MGKFRPMRGNQHRAYAPMTRRTLLATGGAALVTACARGRDPEALRLWAMSYEGDYSPLLMPAFTRATGIPVEVQSLPWTAAHEKLLTAHAGDSLPDVLMLPNGWVGEFALVGALVPVVDPAFVADLFPGTIETVRAGGVDFAVPWSVAPQVQFYRRDLLARAGYDTPPADWDGWRAMGRALKRRRPDDYVMLLLLNWPDALFTFAGQAGAKLLRDRDTRGNFRTPEFRAALGFYKSLFDDGFAPRALSTEIQDPLAAFAQGYFAIYPNGPSLLLDLHRRRAEIAADHWGIARMPGPRGPGAASGVSASLCVSARSHRPADAWSLVRHMTSTATELRFQTLIGNLPARRSAWDHPQLSIPLLRPFAEQMLEPAPAPSIVEWERIRLEVQLIAERVVRGLVTIDQGLIEMNRRADRLLARRRALVEAGKIA